MPLNVKSISISVAVLCFFAIAGIGWISGLSSFTCCKRALIASSVTYVVTTLAVRVINSILTNAMIENQIDQQKGETSGSGN